MNQNTEKSFLGKGWSFPPTFLKSFRELVMTSDEEDIKKREKMKRTKDINEKLEEMKRKTEEWTKSHEKR